MGGFHLLDLIIIAGIALAIFGPKALQSMARNAGKGVGQAKELKDKVMAELPMEEITKVTDHIPQVPMNSRQAIQMLITSETTTTRAKIVEGSTEPVEGTTKTTIPERKLIEE